MSADLTYLVWSAVLAFVQVLVFILSALPVMGLPAAVGNREDVRGDPPGLPGRALRAHRNMIENLVLFAVLVLTAHVAGKANAMTALGAQIFFFARVAYALLYIAGVPWLRSLAWAAGVVGMGLILAQLI